jgi:hypothetical protein
MRVFLFHDAGVELRMTDAQTIGEAILSAA